MSGSFEIFAEARGEAGWRLLGGLCRLTGLPEPLEVPHGSVELISNAFGAGYRDDWSADWKVPVPLRGLPHDLSPTLRDYVEGVPAYGDLDRPGWLRLDEVTGFDWRGRFAGRYYFELWDPAYDPSRRGADGERSDGFFSRVLPRLVAESSPAHPVRLVFFWLYS